MYFFKKIKRIFVFLVVLLFVVFVLSRGHTYEKNELRYGVTFSKKQAQNLGLDWKKTYISILDDLRVKRLRIPAYWDEVEGSFGEFFWADLDWKIKEAEKRNIDIILSVGSRLPRWPECHFPDWVEPLSQEEREKEVMEYVNKTVSRYKGYKNIIAWQVENEPFLTHFGECPKLNSSFLDMEIAEVKRLDNRPIIITDSGEFSFWFCAASRADIFGTTMYKSTYSRFLKRYIEYPISPGFFKFKKNIVNFFVSPQKWIVVELQGEPWGPKPYQDMSVEERGITMNLQKFKDMIEFSSKTGFQEFYFWGVEWWYWEKEKQNNPRLFNEAVKLFGK